MIQIHHVDGGDIVAVKQPTAFWHTGVLEITVSYGTTLYMFSVLGSGAFDAACPYIDEPAMADVDIAGVL
ncbi:MAG: hypothetical protein H8D67_11885 [Deltaproteobacteria bacterium]|nr:hypothetical protein [Deltaproteobacteria bacterium]